LALQVQPIKTTAISLQKWFISRAIYRHSLQPDDICSNISFVKPQQAAIELCDWTSVGDVVRGLLLTSLVELQCSKTPFVKVNMTRALTRMKWFKETMMV